MENRTVVAVDIAKSVFQLAISESPDQPVRDRRLRRSEFFAYFEKLPQTEDRYFQSRPISDMADRAHSMHSLRHVPATALALGQALLDLVLTLGGLLWLAPAAFHWAAIIAVASIVIPLLAASILSLCDDNIRASYTAFREKQSAG